MDLYAPFIRHVLFPAMEVAKGNQIRNYLKQLKQSQHLDHQQLHHYRLNKLKQLLEHAIQHVPAYQKYNDISGLIAEDPIRALQSIPVLTKHIFQQHSEQYLSDQADKNSLINNRTGGSTGQPMSFYIDRVTVEHYEAARWRGLSWHDVHIGDSSMMIWGSPIEISQLENKKYMLKERLLKNRQIIPAFHLNELHINDYIEQINRFKPKYLYGYASALDRLATLINESRKRGDLGPNRGAQGHEALDRGARDRGARTANHVQLTHRIQCVVSTAETLHEHFRLNIEEAFGCPVVNEYGARDGGIIAYECSHGNMHIQAENLWLETVDLVTGEPVGVGERGALVVTDLNNFAQPRLRYSLGDVGILSEEQCECGINLPLIASIEGREEDFFVSTDGTFVHGQFFGHIIRSLDHIVQYQVLQHSRDSLTVKIVLANEASVGAGESARDGYGTAGTGVHDGHREDDQEGHQAHAANIEEDIGTGMGTDMGTDISAHLVEQIKKKMGDIQVNIELVADIPPSASGKIRTAIREFPL